MSKFNKNSDAYIIVFAVIMTLFLGSVLASAQEILKEKQAEQREFERKKFILSAALGRDKVDEMVEKDRNQVEQLYDTRVNSLVVNAKGEKMEGQEAPKINISKQFKEPKEKRMLPVYVIAKEGSDQIEYYVLPVYGNGLWDNIWGYVCLQGDLNTVQGVIFDHKGETPGLGARITESEVQARFQGKKIYEGSKMVSVVMQKGEGADYADALHKVNGMTGATITGNGLNDMLLDYLLLYENYFKSVTKSEQ